MPTPTCCCNSRHPLQLPSTVDTHGSLQLVILHSFYSSNTQEFLSRALSKHSPFLPSILRICCFMLYIFFICTHLNLCLDRYSSSMLNKSYSGNTHTFFQDHPVLTESTNGNPNNCSQGCLETLYKHKPLKDCKFL